MRIKKSGGKIFGASLTNAEKKAMELEIMREIAEHDRKHEIEIDALILWQLHEQLGFGPKRLKQFYDRFVPAIDELITRYEKGDSDLCWLCTYKLKEIGVDIEKWHNERK